MKLTVHEYMPDGVTEVVDESGTLIMSNEEGGEIFWKTILQRAGVEVETIWHIDEKAMEKLTDE